MKLYPVLHQLIGQRIMHNNQSCTLIEVLENGPYLVFQCTTARQIQPNQHGNAHRRCSPNYTIACLNEAADDLHPLLKGLISDEQQIELLEALLKHSL